MTLERHFVCLVSELPSGEARRVDLDPPIAVFNIDGEFLATADTCTHDDSSLAEGYIEGDQVECAWHFARFCLRSGEALTAPAFRPLTTYAVEVADDQVFVLVSHPAGDEATS